MALFSLTINNLSPAMERQHQELQRVQQYLVLAAEDMRGAGGKKTSGNIIDTGGATVVGSWTYTPQAGS
jgi:hypothetical protein